MPSANNRFLQAADFESCHSEQAKICLEYLDDGSLDEGDHKKAIEQFSTADVEQIQLFGEFLKMGKLLQWAKLCEHPVLLVDDANADPGPGKTSLMTMVCCEFLNKNDNTRKDRKDWLVVPFSYQWHCKETQTTADTVYLLVRSFIRQVINKVEISPQVFQQLYEDMLPITQGRSQTRDLDIMCSMLKNLLMNLPHHYWIYFLVDGIHHYQKNVDQIEASEGRQSSGSNPQLPRELIQFFRIFEEVQGELGSTSEFFPRLLLTGEPIPEAVKNYFPNNPVLTRDEVKQWFEKQRKAVPLY